MTYQKKVKSEIEKKSREATNRHLNNIKRLSKGNPSMKELKEMYSYLDNCWICEKPITFWDRITFNSVHSFEGQSHKRNCKSITN